MAELSQKLQLLLGCILPVSFILSAKASGQQTVVCGSSSASQPLSCTDTQWVRIVAEMYVPQTDPGSTCQQQNISTCNAYFYDTGMVANCNGPARGGGACREEVNVAAARRVTTCLRDVADVATIIQYKCIEGSSVLNLCNANVTMWTSNLPLYLASPGYVQLTPAGRMCTCDIQGSDLKMNAVEINVMSKLAWGDNATDGNSYSDMFSVTSGGKDLWRSSNCAGCTTTNLVNSNLFLPVGDGTRYPNVTVTYSDFGLAGQNVWVEIFESGPSISVSCRSTPLPPDKMITTSTRAATTTSASTFDRPTPSKMPTTTSPEHRTNTSPTETSAAPTTKVTTTRPKEPSSTSPPSTSASTSVYSKSTDAGNLISADQQGDSRGEVTLIVTLTVILCVLVVIGSVLAFLIYRKRHIFKSDDYITPWVLIMSWYHRMFQQKPQRSPHQNGCGYGNFDSVLVQTEPHQRQPCETVSDVHSSGRPSAGNTGSAQNCEDITRANNSLLIPPKLYHYHQQLLDEQLDKMRRERSSKTNPKMTTNVPVDACFSNSKSLDENSLQEPDSQRTSAQRQGPSREITNMPVSTTKKLYSGTDVYMDPVYTNDASGNTNTDSRNTDIDKHAAETHKQDLACLSADEHRMFEALGINTHPHKHNVRDRHTGGKKSPVAVDYQQKKASTAEENNIRKSDMKKESVSSSQDSESSCKRNTFLEPVAFFHNENDPSAATQHWHGGKDSKPDIVSSIIQKCSQDIRHRRNEMKLPTKRNTSSGEEGEAGVQTSEC